MRFLNKHSFKGKLFASFIVIGVVPLLLMALISYFNTVKLIKDKISSSIVQNLQIASSLIDSNMRDFTSIVSFISQNSEIQRILNKKEYKDYNDRFADVQSVYRITNILLATEKLDVPIYITGQGALSKFSTTDSFAPIYANINGEIFKSIDKVEDGKELIYIHRRVDGRDSKDVVMAIGKQIISAKNSEKLGYVVMDVYDEYFNDIFKSVNVYSGSNMYILNKDDTIITDKLYKNRTGFKFYEKYLDSILENKSGRFDCIIDGEKNILYFTTSNSGLKVIETVPAQIMYKDSIVIVRTFVFLAVWFSIIAILCSFLLSKSISDPVNNLSKLMHEVEKGNRDVSFDLVQEDEIGQLGKSFNNMIKEINRLIEEVYMKQYLLKEAEFKALKAQVNPHFLYNALESIKWMAKLGEKDNVVLMVTALGKFLRYSISNKGDIVTVREDIEQINNYLTIQKIRYGDKINVEIDIEENLYDKEIIKLLLQPLVENAIVHGLEPKRDKGNLYIKGYIQDDDLCFEIIDDGVGIGNSVIKGEGIGISNVNRRIKLHYGEDYGVVIENKQGFTIVKVSVPDSYKI
ncbi:cache domain-containing sensor histidine kinase [Clostridium thermopalmarium]|uniref:Sensor histidine kinase YehU n=1 Tax=Clostridium thermopalmarium DSM 5974 TaxID=1121340 RepID=A0A2T0AP42_9CLOT|nr:sensor histidine kinase [Clostridium thermopalmarium]PRR70775.1 Sensor histidine kinase YehU [Clostridium thermopalmarium DSM 5974]PVZ22544.1 two-component system sensor histidine kinase YesM [Clostridium thermopalmarium DSM 5974]